jgi:hypothetical protein
MRIMNDGLERKLSFLLFQVLSQYLLKETQDKWSLSPDSSRVFLIISPPMVSSPYRGGGV